MGLELAAVAEPLLNLQMLHLQLLRLLVLVRQMVLEWKSELVLQQ
jgi:hypothetical protein